MNHVRFGFSTTSAPLSRLIRWVTRGQASHCFFVYWSADFAQDMVLEATLQGVRAVSWSRYKEQNHIVDVIPAQWPIEPALMHHVEWLGANYDFTGLLGAGVEVASSGAVRVPFQDPDALFCSEFIVRVLQASHYPRAESLSLSGTTPDKLRAFLQPKN